MIAVFSGFILSDDVVIKSIGFALAFGVLADAFLVRMTLVPAVLALLGRRAWWLPGGWAARCPTSTSRARSSFASWSRPPRARPSGRRRVPPGRTEAHPTDAASPGPARRSDRGAAAARPPRHRPLRGHRRPGPAEAPAGPAPPLPGGVDARLRGRRHLARRARRRRFSRASPGRRARSSRATRSAPRSSTRFVSAPHLPRRTTPGAGWPGGGGRRGRGASSAASPAASTT